MFSKANLISTFVTAIWGLLGGFLLWGIIGEQLFADHVLVDGLMKDPVDFIYLTLGCLINAFAFSSIYGKWANGNYSAGSGFSFGIWIALIMGLGEGLIDYATSNMLDLTGMLMNFVIYLIFLGIMGTLAGLAYKKLA